MVAPTNFGTLTPATIIIFVIAAIIPTAPRRFGMTFWIAEPPAMAPTSGTLVIVTACVTAVIIATGIAASAVITVIAPFVPAPAGGFCMPARVTVPATTTIIVVIATGTTVVEIIIAAGIAATIVIIPVVAAFVPATAGGFSVSLRIAKPAAVAASPVVIVVMTGPAIIVITAAFGIVATTAASAAVIVTDKAALIVTFWHITWHFILLIV
ncbi:hypothetical protein OHAE_4089 [Ochrobactrum soli]|uniref:Uncharacterized protein n=1 Tax=Ochrobactrum soli TaxID=2448455 RepID=A0A2P9HB24_9HYPH|nr:hypothetical protein OHAE_4089 [[Ochrobactrum] soli]